MWKLVYTIDRHYYSNDGYSQESNGDPEEVEGATKEDAISVLMYQLKRDGELNSLIKDLAAGHLNSSDYYSLSVISFDEVVASAELDFNKLPQVKELVAAVVAKANKKAKEDEAYAKGAKRRADKALLAKLKKQYPENS